MRKSGSLIARLSFVVVVAVLFSSFAWAKSTGGTYQGSSVGYHGQVSVTVEIDDKGKILSIVVDDKHHETNG